ncbi:hypothetical protein ID866_9292 [Astraeus odoratus]|nr:hypothetical protein ID866_9292 [Astraeus odoratus]
METVTVLKLLAEAASACNINVNDYVTRDETSPPLHGGSAIVYSGSLRTQAQAVALKSLRLSPVGDNKAVDHIIKEVQRWSKLGHKNIVPVFGIVTKFDFAVSFVSKWMPKGNAYDYVQDTSIDPRPLVRLDTLYACQEILHGDLRGRNVLISEDGHALLADYGLSTLIETSFDTTAAVPIHPTVRWIAPEQIDSNGKVTIQGDVWAFGMTALELFTRRPPYYDIPDTRGVILRILDRPPGRPSDESACFRMTDAWWEICISCWIRNEGSRPPISYIVKNIAAMVCIIDHAYFLMINLVLAGCCTFQWP